MNEIVLPRFSLGILLITCNAFGRLRSGDTVQAIRRHASGDWGDLCPDDRRANELALSPGKHDKRLFSAYSGQDGTRFWVLTEADRSATTVLLPEDF
jgi:hypothetical protein